MKEVPEITKELPSSVLDAGAEVLFDYLGEAEQLYPRTGYGREVVESVFRAMSAELTKIDIGSCPMCGQKVLHTCPDTTRDGP